MAIYDPHKIGAWTTPVVDEADQPVRSAADLKIIFDANSNQIKLAYNALLDELSAHKAAYDAWKAGLENLLTPEQAASLAAAILVLQGQFAGLTPAGIGAEAAHLLFVDQTISTSGWATFTAAAGEETNIQNKGYTYRKSLALTGVTTAMTPLVKSALDKDDCGAQVHDAYIPYNGGIYIYAKSTPSAAWHMLTILVVQGV